MDKSEPQGWELPDSEKTFADIMREAAGGRVAGLRTAPSPPRYYDGRTGNLMLDEVIAFANSSSGCAPWMFSTSIYVYLTIATILLGVLLHGSKPSPLSLLWLIPWVLISAGFCWLLELDYRRHVASIDTILRNSAVVEKLLLGERELAQIYDWTPWPWSLLYLGPRPRHPNRWLGLLAANLDWYIGEPRPLFRVSWALTTAYLVTVVVFDTSVFFGLALHTSFVLAGVWYGFLTYVLLGPTFHPMRKRAISLAVFRRYLRERFVDGDEPPGEQA
jgi:hypothetical protein